MMPTIKPTPYEPGAEVAAWCPAADGRVVVEVFRRSAGLYGFRYQAWVAWRDAGDEVRDHSWWEAHPDRALFASELPVAQAAAEEDAKAAGVILETNWRVV